MKIQEIVYTSLFSVKFNFPEFKKTKELSDIVEAYDHTYLSSAELMGLDFDGNVVIQFNRCELLVEFLKELIPA